MEITLTDDQQSASEQFMSFMANDTETFMIIRGGAGCGKSTMTQYVLENVKKEMGMLSLIMNKSSLKEFDIHVTAPTNQAAKVIASITGYEPKTIQSLLGLRPIPDGKGGMKLVSTKDNKGPIEKALILIDEGSFIGQFLLKCIIERCIRCKVLIIGDPYQLAPPKETVLPAFDMGVREAVLTTVMRNPGPIAELGLLYRDVVAEFIRINKLNLAPIAKMQAVEKINWPAIKANGKEILYLSSADFQAAVDAEFSILNRGDNDAKILAWRNKVVNGYNGYARSLQGLPDGIQEGEHVVSNKPIIWRDQKGTQIRASTDEIVVVTTVGDAEIREGVAGVWVSVDNSNESFFQPDNQDEVASLLKQLAIQKNWSLLYEIKEQWLDLRPLHASTVHKSQGATYRKVFIDLNDIGLCSTAEDVARMLHVASTRASDQVIFCGQLPKKYSPKVV